MLLSKHDLAAAAAFLKKNAPESCKVVELLASGKTLDRTVSYLTVLESLSPAGFNPLASSG